MCQTLAKAKPTLPLGAAKALCCVHAVVIHKTIIASVVYNAVVARVVASVIHNAVIASVVHYTVIAAIIVVAVILKALYAQAPDSPLCKVPDQNKKKRVYRKHHVLATLRGKAD